MKKKTSDTDKFKKKLIFNESLRLDNLKKSHCLYNITSYILAIIYIGGFQEINVRIEIFKYIREIFKRKM